MFLFTIQTGHPAKKKKMQLVNYFKYNFTVLSYI